MRLLLCEDDDAYATAFMTAIEAYRPSWQVTHVPTLQAGVDAIDQDGPYDVIVVDLQLPDARETVAVRLFVRCAPDTPLVVLTAFADFAHACLALGADAYLLKASVTCEELVETLQAIREGTLNDGTGG